MTRLDARSLIYDLAEGLLIFIGAMFFAGVIAWVTFCFMIGEG